jgi:hypothetical protein
VISGATSARTYRNRDIADRNGIMRTMVVRKLMGGCVDSHERNLKDKGVRFAFVSSFDLARACASPDCCTCFRDHANVQNHDWWDERANLMREPLPHPADIQMFSLISFLSIQPPDIWFTSSCAGILLISARDQNTTALVCLRFRPSEYEP